MEKLCIGNCKPVIATSKETNKVAVGNKCKIFEINGLFGTKNYNYDTLWGLKVIYFQK